MSEWSRNAATGMYVFKRDPRLTVATYCECRRSSCAYRWSAFWDRGYAPESVPTTSAFTLVEAKHFGLDVYDELVANDGKVLS